MTLTLLFDLDNTLLGNDMDTFLPAYLQALAGHLSPVIEPGLMIQSLLDATRRMVANQDPSCKLEDIFDDAFYPALGIEKAVLRPRIDTFYEQIFPTLRPLTRFRPEAVKLVEAAFSRGYQIAIATNPLFPLTAVMQRLKWAGFDQHKYSFAAVGSYEQFHFSKPNPAYFAEILAMLDWPEGPVLVVGDDLARDIEPASQMGLATYWVAPQDSASEEATHLVGQGSLNDFLPWLDALPSNELQADWKLPGALLATLASTPAYLDGLCRALPQGSWRRRPTNDQWCATEVICHMRDVEREVNLQRVKTVLKESNPFIPGKDTDPWAEQRQYYQQDGQRALQSFIAARQELIAILKKSSPDAWERPARHAILGPTNLAELVEIIAEHDRLHIRQVRKILAVR